MSEQFPNSKAKQAVHFIRRALTLDETTLGGSWEQQNDTSKMPKIVKEFVGDFIGYYMDHARAIDTVEQVVKLVEELFVRNIVKRRVGGPPPLLSQFEECIL